MKFYHSIVLGAVIACIPLSFPWKMHVQDKNNSPITAETRIPSNHHAEEAVFEIQGRVTVTNPCPERNVLPETMPLADVPVALLQGTQRVARAITDQEGYYSLFTSSKENLSLKVTLTHGATKPSYFYLTYNDSRTPASITTKPFTISDSETTSITKDIRWGNVPEIVPDNIIKRRIDIDDMGAIYFLTHQAWDLAANRLQQELDLPFYVATFDTVRTEQTRYAFWQGPTNNLGDSEPLVSLSPSESDVCQRGLALTVWHEFGHQVMADTFDNTMPDRGENSINHDGYQNPSTSDSWMEGFATFYALLVDKEIAHLMTPSQIYLDENLEDFERNRLAWETVGEISFEEFGITSLLWDLADPVDPEDKTPLYFNPEEMENVGIYLDASDGEPKSEVTYADEIDVGIDALWQILQQSTYRDVNPDPQNKGYAYLVDVDQFYTVLKAWEKEHIGEESASMDALFISHGFFADVAAQNLFFDTDEEIGKTSHKTFDYGQIRYVEQVPRRSPPPPPDSYIILKLIDNITGKLLERTQFQIEIRFDPPYERYNLHYLSSVDQLGRLNIRMPDPHFPATILITPVLDNNQITEPLKIPGKVYWQMQGAYRRIRADMGDKPLDTLKIEDLQKILEKEHLTSLEKAAMDLLYQNLTNGNGVFLEHVFEVTHP